MQTKLGYVSLNGLATVKDYLTVAADAEDLRQLEQLENDLKPRRIKKT